MKMHAVEEGAVEAHLVTVILDDDNFPLLDGADILLAEEVPHPHPSGEALPLPVEKNFDCALHLFLLILPTAGDAMSPFFLQ